MKKNDPYAPILLHIGHRVYCPLHGMGMGTVISIEGTQTPASVHMAADGIIHGGSALFSVVLDSGLPVTVAEGELRSSWRIYPDIIDAAKIAVAKDAAEVYRQAATTVAAQERERQQDEVDQLVNDPQNAGLISGTDKTGLLATKNLRRQLRTAHPRTKFRVHCLGAGNVAVSWVNGPTRAQVNELACRYVLGVLDPGTNEYHPVANAWADAFGGARYLTVSRSYTFAMLERAIDKLFRVQARHLVGIERPTAQELAAGHAWITEVPTLDDNLERLVHSTANDMEG